MASDPMVELEVALMDRLGVDNTALSDDPELATLLPGGIHSRTAGGDTYPYLTFVLVRQDDDHTYGEVYRHRFRYNLQVTDQAESIDQASAALARVYELLQDCDEDPTMAQMANYRLGFSRRAGRINTTPTSIGQEYQVLADEWRFEVFPT